MPFGWLQILFLLNLSKRCRKNKFKQKDFHLAIIITIIIIIIISQ